MQAEKSRKKEVRKIGIGEELDCILLAWETDTETCKVSATLTVRETSSSRNWHALLRASYTHTLRERNLNKESETHTHTLSGQILIWVTKMYALETYSFVKHIVWNDVQFLLLGFDRKQEFILFLGFNRKGKWFFILTRKVTALSLFPNKDRSLRLTLNSHWIDTAMKLENSWYCELLKTMNN